MKSEEKNKARELRSQGLSIKKIAKMIDVSTSSVSLWVKNIILTNAQILSLKADNPAINGQMAGAKARKDKALIIRKQYQEEGKIKAREGNSLHQGGCMLYWGEGNKSKNTCGLSNSDPELLKYFIKFLYECYEITPSDILIKTQYYLTNNISLEEIEKYWSKTLNLPIEKLYY